MTHRLTYEEKGKAIGSPTTRPRVSRIKAPDSDNSELLLRHKLTLIGRLTNPTVQKTWSLIPFFTEHWKTSSRPIGAELGHVLFQFQFANEEDLQLVLANRPYHFAGYMVILQRWEPTTSRSFPSEIPFWIQVTGIPVHLWTSELIKSIGEDIGAVEKLDVSVTTARMRVRINGLQPLIKTSIVEYSNGEEVEAELVYERLKKHCKICYRLDHDDKECPSSKTSVSSRPSTASRKRKEETFSKRSAPVPRPPRRDESSLKSRLDYSPRRKEAYHTTGRMRSSYSDRYQKSYSRHRKSPSPSHGSSFHHHSRGSPPRFRSRHDQQD